MRANLLEPDAAADGYSKCEVVRKTAPYRVVLRTTGAHLYYGNCSVTRVPRPFMPGPSVIEAP